MNNLMLVNQFGPMQVLNLTRNVYFIAHYLG